MVTAQVDRLKAARGARACAARRLLGKAHFKAMVDAQESHPAKVLQSCFLNPSAFSLNSFNLTT